VAGGTIGRPRKKLTDAVAHLLRGSGGSYDDDLEYWGAPADYLPEAPADFEVWPENWDVLQLFLRLQTQWHTGPSGHRTGLLYSSIPVVSRVLGIKTTPDLFDDLQLMELTLINLGMDK
jgi:Phage related hypothetical protein (DUF1799)